MIDYIVIFTIVGVAAFFVGRHLWREAKSGQCANCDCASKHEASSSRPHEQFPV
jgi:hypothetical protein